MIIQLPFTSEQFLDVFQQYNIAVWPMQLIINLLGFLAIGIALIGSSRLNRLINSILVFLWLWMGIVYQWFFFSKINQVAFIFGGLFILQAIIFLYTGSVKKQLSFKFQKNINGILGIFFFIYALIVYPILSSQIGHRYPASPTFGLPCPTTIFTFGLLLWAGPKVPLYCLIIPFIWSLIGFSAAQALSMAEDYGLFVAGLLGTIIITGLNYNLKKS